MGFPFSLWSGEVLWRELPGHRPEVLVGFAALPAASNLPGHPGCDN